MLRRKLLALVLLAAALAGAPAAAEPVRILALGDSLTAGYGLTQDQGFTARLERELAALGVEVRVLNAGVSGDTTAGGRARLGWALAEKPDFALVALGANDMLRGVDPAETEANLDAILTELGERRIPTLLAGMFAGRNLGADYVERFEAIFPRLAEKHGVPLYPFFLDGVAGDPALNQDDGLHPNAQGAAVMAARLAPHVKRLIEGAGAS